MKNIINQMTAELDTWLESYQRSEKSASPQADPEAVAMKARWLAVIEDYKSGPDGEVFTIFVDKIEQIAPDLRENIGKLLYEGTFSEESVKELLDSSLTFDAVSNSNCIGCVGCTACVVCSSCALCVITGVVIASTAITTSSSATSVTSAM